MKLLLNEQIYIDKMLNENKFSLNFGKSFYLLSKYFNEQGYSKGETFSYLVGLCSERNIDIQIENRYELLKSVVDTAYQYNKPVVKIESIPISKSEWEVINSLKDEIEMKIAYVLLVNVKAKAYTAGKQIEWFNGSPDDLLKEAGLRIGLKDKMKVFHSLYKKGILIDSERLDTFALKCLFVNYDDRRVEFNVYDFENIMTDYNLKTGSLIVCGECGTIFKKPKGKGKGKVSYCSDKCKNEARKRQKRENAKQRRS